jgi:hypothetical protein
MLASGGVGDQVDPLDVRQCAMPLISIDLKHGFVLLADTKNGDRRELPMNQTVRQMLTQLIPRIGVP